MRTISVILAAASIAVLSSAPVEARAHHAVHKQPVVRTEDDPLYMENYQPPPVYAQEYHQRYANEDDDYPSDYPYAAYPPSGAYGQGTSYRGMPLDPRMPPGFVRW